MPLKTLRTSLHQKLGIAVIDLRGELDGAAHGILRDAFATAKAWRSPAVLLNFAGVGYINSKGIALIVGLLSEARRSSTPLLACGLSEHYVEIFEITRLSDYIDVYPDESTALLEARSLRETLPAQREDRPVSAP
jgi:anti-sigma B factor antagonist